MTINVGASGGLKPPTSLQNRVVAGQTNQAGDISSSMGAVETAAITSLTITEVLNISGSGVLTLSAISASGANLTGYKITIVIDGTTVVSELAGGPLSSTTAAFQVGTFSNDTGASASAEGEIVFNSSLVVEIAGDGTNGAQYVYKRYLT